MVSIIAAITPIIVSGLVSINTFKKLPPLPDYILFPPSSLVIPSIIEVPDDPEVN